MKIYLYVIILFVCVFDASAKDIRFMLRLKTENQTLINQIATAENIKFDIALKPEQSLTYYLEKKATMNQSINSLKVTKIIKAENPLLRSYFAKTNSELEFDKYAKYLYSKYPGIELIEYSYPCKPMGQFFPSDNLLTQQGNLWKIKALEAWDIYKGSPDMTIAISDVGFLTSHEDLKDNIAINTLDPVNGIDDDGNGYIDDYDGYDMQDNGDHRNEVYNAAGSHGTYD